MPKRHALSMNKSMIGLLSKQEKKENVHANFAVWYKQVSIWILTCCQLRRVISEQPLCHQQMNISKLLYIDIDIYVCVCVCKPFLKSKSTLNSNTTMKQDMYMFTNIQHKFMKFIPSVSTKHDLSLPRQ